MAVFDTIWIFVTSAAILAFIAVIGFIVLKIGFALFKTAMEPLKAARGIENIETVGNNSNFRITEEEEDELEVIRSFIKAEIDKSRYASYLYKLFKIDTIIVHSDSLKSSIKSKIKKNNYTKYAYIQLFKK
jgi:hypothetical protein